MSVKLQKRVIIPAVSAPFSAIPLGAMMARCFLPPPWSSVARATHFVIPTAPLATQAGVPSLLGPVAPLLASCPRPLTSTPLGPAAITLMLTTPLLPPPLLHHASSLHGTSLEPSPLCLKALRLTTALIAVVSSATS